MSLTPTDEAEHSDGEANNQADMLKGPLRTDVASWSAARSEVSAQEAAEVSVPAATQPSLQPARRVKRPRPASPDVNTTAAGPKKPFSMSYDGVSEADYITYMIARGAR